MPSNDKIITDQRKDHTMIKRSPIKGEAGQEIIISAPHIKVGRVWCWGARRQTLAGNILIRFSI